MQNQSNTTAIAAANNPVISGLFDQYEVGPHLFGGQHTHYSEFELISFELSALDLLQGHLEIDMGLDAYRASQDYVVIQREIKAFELLQEAMRPFH